MKKSPKIKFTVTELDTIEEAIYGDIITEN